VLRTQDVKGIPIKTYMWLETNLVGQSLPRNV
jgi:hypothetical protein